MVDFVHNPVLRQEGKRRKIDINNHKGNKDSWVDDSSPLNESNVFEEKNER